MRSFKVAISNSYAVMSSFCPAKQKLISPGTEQPRSRRNTRKRRGRARAARGKTGPPTGRLARSVLPSPGRRRRLHPKINSDSRFRPRLGPPRPGPSRPLAPPAPAAPACPAAAGQGVRPGDRGLAPRPRPGRPRHRPRRGPAGPAGGPRARPGPRGSPAPAGQLRAGARAARPSLTGASSYRGASVEPWR